MCFVLVFYASNCFCCFLRFITSSINDWQTDLIDFYILSLLLNFLEFEFVEFIFLDVFKLLFLACGL
jgi:hypothetical protein